MTSQLSSVHIRPESADDIAEIHKLNELAFGQSQEAELVDRVRLSSDRIISLVAETGESIVGHILLSPVNIGEGAEDFRAAGLGPLAVMPDNHKRGIGKQLVNAGIQECRNRGFEMVFVLGHPEYYPKFGFSLAGEYGYYYKSQEYDPYFYVLVLTEGPSMPSPGEVRYLPPFDDA